MRLFIILFTLSCSTFFLFVPKEGEIGFLFSDIVLTPDQYVWMLCEHLVIVGLALVVFLQEQKYKKAMAVFLGLQVADTVGWVLTYDDPMKGLPLTFNEVKIILFLFVIVYELQPLWKMKGRN